MIPSVTTIDVQLCTSIDDARLVREVLEFAEDASWNKTCFRRYVENQLAQFPDTLGWLMNNFRYRDPSRVELALQCIDEIIGGFGVECIFERDEMFPVLSYVNKGDTYDPTICYRYDVHRFVVSCWGDEVERLENRGFDIA